MDHSTQSYTTKDSIRWHIERFEPRGATLAEEIILIPSGEGDCHNLVGLARILCSEYRYKVLTFDNPGFSRTEAPLEAYDVVMPHLMASQIQGLLSELGIQRVSAFGCSSGGLAVLALAASYPESITCGIVHEVPFECPQPLIDLQKLSDEQVAALCKHFFATGFIEDEAKWAALGAEYHKRLSKNYVTWMRHVVGRSEDASRKIATAEYLNKRPLFWTVGALTPGAQEHEGIWALDFTVAESAGLQVDTTTLKCMHFPAVTVPDATAKWIDGCIKKVEKQ